MRRRLAANAGVLTSLKVAAPATSFLLVMAVSRRLGAEGLGRYSFAYAWLALFVLPGPLGLPTLITREGARDAAILGRLLSDSTVLSGAMSMLLSGAMALSARATALDPASKRAIVILSLAILPTTLQAHYDAAFLALEQTYPMILAAFAENCVKVGAGLAFLAAGLGLDSVLAAAVAGRAASAIVSVFLLRRRGVRMTAQVDRVRLRSLARQTPVFALSAVCATLYWRIDVLLLGRLRGMAEAGCYAAAYRILDLATFLPQSFCLAIYPAMSAGRPPSRGAAAWLLGLTAPAALVVSIAAGPLLHLLYGVKFVSAGSMLAILIWTAVPYAWNRYQACALLAAGRQRADLAINASLLAANVIANLLLIPAYGGYGAAVVTLGTAIFYGSAQFSLLRRPGTICRWAGSDLSKRTGAQRA